MEGFVEIKMMKSQKLWLIYILNFGHIVILQKFLIGNDHDSH